MLRWAYVLLLLAAVDGLLGIGGTLAATGGSRVWFVAYALLVVALIALSVASISRERDAHFWRPPPRGKPEASRRPARGRSMLTH
jgi:uncharacterized membrane protein YtjA (UPF0391 family)